MEGAPPVSADQLKAPYSERWALLKDVMEWLYLEQKKKFKDIVQIMKTQYQFYASLVIPICRTSHINKFES